MKVNNCREIIVYQDPMSVILKKDTRREEKILADAELSCVLLNLLATQTGNKRLEALSEMMLSFVEVRKILDIKSSGSTINAINLLSPITLLCTSTMNMINIISPKHMAKMREKPTL